MKILAQEKIPGLLSSPKRRNFLVAGSITYDLTATSSVISSRHSARTPKHLVDKVRFFMAEAIGILRAEGIEFRIRTYVHGPWQIPAANLK